MNTHLRIVILLLQKAEALLQESATAYAKAEYETVAKKTATVKRICATLCETIDSEKAPGTLAEDMRLLYGQVIARCDKANEPVKQEDRPVEVLVPALFTIRELRIAWQDVEEATA